MVRPGHDRLRGLVEIDETCMGGIEQGTRGRGTECRFIVVIAIEILSPNGYGRVHLARVENVPGAGLIPLVSDAVETGAEVRTDGSAGCSVRIRDL
jgi:hypothetical protein